MSDKNTTATQDDLAKVERTVYNALGISQNMFNADGNLTLANSILNDEGSFRTLILQFEIFFDRVVQQLSASKKKYNFRLYMLETTQYNYKELAKMYKISHKTIENWINKTNKGIDVLDTNKSLGRPKKVTDYKQRYEIVKKMEKFLKELREKKPSL